MHHINLTREEQKKRQRIVKVTVLVILALALGILTWLNINL